MRNTWIEEVTILVEKQIQRCMKSKAISFSRDKTGRRTPAVTLVTTLIIFDSIFLSSARAIVSRLAFIVDRSAKDRESDA